MKHIEEMRYKVFDIKAKCDSDLGALAQQLQSKSPASDDIDLRLKESVKKNFNDTILGRRVIEMLVQQLQVKGTGIDAT